MVLDSPAETGSQDERTCQADQEKGTRWNVTLAQRQDKQGVEKLETAPVTLKLKIPTDNVRMNPRTKQRQTEKHTQWAIRTRQWY